MRFHSLAIVACSCLPTVAFAEDAYLCVADTVAGFSFDANAKQWSAPRVEPTKNSLLLAPGHILMKHDANWHGPSRSQSVPYPSVAKSSQS